MVLELGLIQAATCRGGLPCPGEVLYGNLLWDGALSLCRFFASAAAPSVAGKGLRVAELGIPTCFRHVPLY